MRIGLLCLSLLLSQFLTSCADQHLVTDQLIVGGTKLLDADEVSSHLVNISLPGEFGNPMVCTGVFVSSKLILTAKHCVSSKLNDISVTFRPANYKENGNVVNLTILDTKPVVVPSDVRENLILLKFSEPLPDAAKIAKISSLNNLGSRTEFSVAGYGMHAKKVDLKNTTLIYGDKARFKNISVAHIEDFKNYFIIDQQKAGGGVCAGDSGGPAYYIDSVTKEMNLIGIASAVSAEDTSSNCLNKSYIIKTDFLKER